MYKFITNLFQKQKLEKVYTFTTEFGLPAQTDCNLTTFQMPVPFLQLVMILNWHATPSKTKDEKQQAGKILMMVATVCTVEQNDLFVISKLCL